MKLTNEEIRFINALTAVSGVSAKDCIIDNKVICYLVNKDDVGKAIGKGASNIKKLGKKLNRNVEIIGHYKDVEEFVKKSLYNISISSSEIREKDEKKEMVISLDAENRKKLTSKLGKLRRIKEIAKRNYGIDNIRTG